MCSWIPTRVLFKMGLTRGWARGSVRPAHRGACQRTTTVREGVHEIVNADDGNREGYIEWGRVGLGTRRVSCRQAVLLGRGHRPSVFARPSRMATISSWDTCHDSAGGAGPRWLTSHEDRRASDLHATCGSCPHIWTPSSSSSWRSWRYPPSNPLKAWYDPSRCRFGIFRSQPGRAPRAGRALEEKLVADARSFCRGTGRSPETRSAGTCRPLPPSSDHAPWPRCPAAIDRHESTRPRHQADVVPVDLLVAERQRASRASRGRGLRGEGDLLKLEELDLQQRLGRGH